MARVILALALLASASAYTTRSTPSMIGRKGKTAPEPAAPTKGGSKGPMLAPTSMLLGKTQTYFGGEEQKSVALPYTSTTLPGDLPGDVGFDPFGLAAYAPGCWFLGERYKDIGVGTLTWYREAELMHGRIAQLAALGWVFPEIAHFPGKPSMGIDFSELNPLAAIDSVPSIANWQIFAFATLLEGGRIRTIIDQGDDYVAGDLGLGQGPLQTSPFGNGRFNPFNLDYTPEEYAEKQLQEIKHCRLAMLAIAVMYLKTTGFEAGEGILGDLGVGAFTQPEYFEKAGYFFPDGV